VNKLTGYEGAVEVDDAHQEGHDIIKMRELALADGTCDEVVEKLEAPHCPLHVGPCCGDLGAHLCLTERNAVMVQIRRANELDSHLTAVLDQHEPLVGHHSVPYGINVR
jgi:hypothetical protein